MDTELAGNRYLVTGGASGIGRGTVELLLARGADVWSADLDEAGLLRLRAETSTPRLRTSVLDATDPSAWTECAASIEASWGALTGCVLNVGKNQPGRLDEISLDDWSTGIRLTLDSAVHGFRALSPLLGDGASIVFTTSIHAFLGFTGFPAYAAAKGALTSLVRQLAVDLAPRIRVNAVAPGAILTAIWERRDQEFRDRVASRVPLRRIGTAQEAAEAIGFLLSPRASYITGQTLIVDGGRTISAAE